MTPSEVALVLTKCSSYDQRTIGEEDAFAWHEILADLGLADCTSAVVGWYAVHRDRIMPSDIRTAVLEIRAARLRRGPSDEQIMSNVDPSDPGYFAELQRRREIVASGGYELRAVTA